MNFKKIFELCTCKNQFTLLNAENYDSISGNMARLDEKRKAVPTTKERATVY